MQQHGSFLDQLKRLAEALAAEELFPSDGQPELRKLLWLAKRRRIDLRTFFIRSLRFKSGNAYLVARKEKGEVLICVRHPRYSKSIPNIFDNGERHTFPTSDKAAVTAHLVPFTNENLRKLIEEALPEAGPKNLQSTPRLGLGVRMLFTLPPLLMALDRAGTISDFQLSAGREFSLEEVIRSPPGKYPEWLGHTGTDASTLYGTIAKECFKFGLSNYGTEIDHLIVTCRPEEAISRIRRPSPHVSTTVNLDTTSESALQESIEYNRRIINEAARTGFVRGMTVDSSALMREEFDDSQKWTGQPLKAEFEKQFSAEEGKALMERYRPGEAFHFKAQDGDQVLSLAFSEEDVMRLALKFTRSLAVNKSLFDHMSKAMNGKTFAFEPSLDEAYKLTTSKELFFYLSESTQMGMRADLIAPNIGLRKREDYDGDLNELQNRIRELSIIASNFGTILDFHSGSDKSPHVYRTLSRACNRRLKLKMSGIYQLIYFETLASFPPRSEERVLFEKIWRYALIYAKQKASEGEALAKRQVEQVHQKMAAARKRGARHKPHPNDKFFRYYSFIAVAAKRKNGRYVFRNLLYRLAQTKCVSDRYAQRVIRLTTAVAMYLGLKGGLAELNAEPKPSYPVNRIGPPSSSSSHVAQNGS